MKPLTAILALLTTAALLGDEARGQGFGRPLTTQGIDQASSQSVRSAGEGNIFVGLDGDPSLMFENPASLQSIKEIEVTLNGQSLRSSFNQTQQYAPLKYYSNFSLLMEGLTGYIGNPDTNIAGVKLTNAGDTVQRPYDNYTPGWTHSSTKGKPVQGYLAVPFRVNDMACAIGIGSVEYANLDWYFENNNVLSPSILSVKQSTITIPANNTDSLAIPVQWYLSSQSRLGTLYGYGAAFSAGVSDNIALGVSALILSGRSDDFESRIDRGKLLFYNSFFRLDSVYNRISAYGTSNYSGAELNLSGSYRGRYVALGFSVKPPTTITRKFTTNSAIDTTGLFSTSSVSGEDKTMLPWRGTVGLSLSLRPNLRLGLSYEMRPYVSTKFTASDGSVSYPWLSANLFHIGAEFIPAPWLALRAGARQEAEVFEPVDNPLEGTPVGFTVYSLGVGFVVEEMTVDVAYEYSSYKYSDTWADAVSINGAIRHSVMADVSYRIPW
ncbi:MAG TPA: hypothetical protein VMG34_10965 [Bacteroidota bacterium]|nr:hypothetical protein [Bacteroidota bacterium]